MQTILGAGGAIGQSLAKALTAYTHSIRLVSRQPKRVNPTDELLAADLMDRQQTINAVAGSEVVYLTVGLPYKTKGWEAKWPVLIDNVIAACIQHQAKLVFFDNIYMYDQNALNGMDEQTPIRPSSRKGHVRKVVAERVLAAHHKGALQSLIARSADFYGPGIGNSVLNDLVAHKIMNGKRPQWLCDDQQPHNFTYTPDASRATAQLGNDPTAFGRVWHLPTIEEAPTAQAWCQYFASAAGQKYQRPSMLSPLMIKGLGLVIPSLAALHEMLYQYDRPYRFISNDFTAKYGWSASPIEKAVAAILAHSS